MAVLIPQRIPVDGGAEIQWSNATAGGDQAPCGNGRILLARNGHTGAQTVTVASAREVRGLAVADVAESVTQDGGLWSLPLTDEFANSDGRAVITYSAVTALQVAVIEPER